MSPEEPKQREATTVQWGAEEAARDRAVRTQVHQREQKAEGLSPTCRLPRLQQLLLQL